CRLHGASNGNLFHARIRASHASLAHHVGLSREWTCKLVARLAKAGWIEFTAPRLPDGKFEIGIFKPGRMLKRLLCMLLGYRKPKHHSAKYRVNDSSQFLPTKEQVEKSKTFFTHLLRTLTRQLSVKSER